MSREIAIPHFQSVFITERFAFEALRAEWIELWERCPDAGVFQRPEWLIPWWQHFGPGKDLRVLELRVDGRLAGLLPLAALLQANGSRELQLIGTGNTDRLDALVDPAFATLAIDAWSAWVTQHCTSFDRCVLAQLPATSVLLQLRLPTLNQTRVPAEPCPVVQLSDRQQPEPRRAGPRRYAYYLRRAAREGAHLVEATTADLNEMLDALFALHAARWQERDQSGALSDPIVQAFLIDACTELAGAGMLRLTALVQHHRFIALYLAFHARGRCSGYIGGFDPVYNRLSPGTVLIGQLVEDTMRAGGQFDFLRGREHYKYHWGATDELLWTCIFERRA